MKKWRKVLEDIFAAVSFAESGEYETARAMAGVQPGRAAGLSGAVENVFAAAAFAEAGCRDTALNLMGKSPVRPERQPLQLFLENVGLQGVHVRYGLVTV